MINVSKDVQRLASSIAMQEEHEILGQLSDLVRRGLIVVEKQQAVLVQDRTEIGYMLRILPKIKLVLKDKEYIEELEAQNLEMKAILRDFAETKHCKDTWLYEMYSTIEAVLGDN